MCSLLTERYADKIKGVLSCFDRIVIQGTLPNIGHAHGMTAYLHAHHIRIFDYTQFAEPFRDEIRENAERLAAENGLKIEFVRSHEQRKDELIRKIIRERADRPGLVAILSAMEGCPTYKPWHDKETGENYVKPDQGRCLHYYFYLIDEELGLCYVRVPTWCPFRLQIYFNGHNWLAAQMRKRRIDFVQVENAFVDVAAWEKAQELADGLKAHGIHRLLDRCARQYCPVVRHFGVQYHWSIMQAEYATDIVFRRQRNLQEVYGTLTRTAIHTVKPDNVATFLGRKLHSNYQGELSNDFHTRIEGTRIKHHMGSASIKMYDKFAMILRIETTTDDVSFFASSAESVGWGGGRTAGKSYRIRRLGTSGVRWNLESRFQADPGGLSNSYAPWLERDFFFIRPPSWVNSPTDSAEDPLFQALPIGRTARRNKNNEMGADEEKHLQPGSTARPPPGGQPALSRVHFRHR